MSSSSYARLGKDEILMHDMIGGEEAKIEGSRHVRFTDEEEMAVGGETQHAEKKWKMSISDFEDKYTPEERLKTMPAKTQLFYKHQNDLITEFVKMHQRSEGEIVGGNEEEEEENETGMHPSVKYIIWGAFALNIALLCLKLTAYFFSHSLSVLASSLDSIMDLLSGAIFFIIERVIAKTLNSPNFPAGNKRIEPLGLIVFASVMFTATFQMIIEAVKSLIDLESLDLEMDIFTVSALLSTIASKIILFTLAHVYGSRTGSNTLEAIAQDSRNDIISNSVGMLTAWLGSLYWKPLDPIGAILLCLYIMFTWINTGFDHVRMLSGVSAPPEFLNAITYLASNHDPLIIAVDTVRGYHISYDFLIEVDIVLDPHTPLQTAHDIGESLQKRIESLPRVERAFVHLDFETSHLPEHVKN